MKLECLICHQEMKLSKTLCKVQGKSNRYNMKRYECLICGYVETRAGDNNGDDYRAMLALEDVQRYFKQEENNRL